MKPAFQPKFGHAADEFQRYRPDYPAALYEHILARVPEQCRGRAMDLGAGTGIVTGHLVAHFREVLSVEPDAGMASKIAGHFPQAVIRNVTAEDCAQPPESVDLITIANALHWMDADRVLANAHSWLRPEAVLAVFDRPLPKATPEIDAIVLAELRGPWKPHRDPRLKRDRGWENQVRAAPGFRAVEETKFPNIISMSAQDYAGFWRSTSYASAYARTLADPEPYWGSLESRFAAAGAGAMISVDFSPTLILARKP
ncbi:MAG TPA: methyltransferase domain-containing protein [Candidatus Acidoferrales bacterium]|nr:methyltransferase domain-containing protein [Candidatus Acidoferrales bacterium]